MTVYFARVRGYVKVGFSKNPFARSLTITRGGIRPPDMEPRDRVDLLGWFPGDRSVERATHATLGAHHVCGEWFRDVPAVESYLRDQDGFDDGLNFIGPDGEVNDLARRQVKLMLDRRASERELWRNAEATA